MTKRKDRGVTRHTRSEFLKMAAASAALVSAGGCAAARGESTGQGRVRILRVAAPLEEPVWVPGKMVLIAKVAGEPRLARIQPVARQARTLLSGAIAGMGSNADVDPESGGDVYVPQTPRDRILVLSTDDLRERDTIEDVPSPARISVHPGSKTIFTLNPAGTRLTPVDLYTSDITPGVGKPAIRRTVEAMGGGAGADIRAPARNIDPTVWVGGKAGLGYYQGKPYPVEKESAVSRRARTFAVDMVKDTRAYVGPSGSSELLRIELNPATRQLQVTARMKTGSPVEYIAVDENRVYAATGRELITLRADNFLGVAGFKEIETIPFRRNLGKGPLASAPLAGLATGNDTHEVYLTFRDRPYVAAILKPNDSL